LNGWKRQSYANRYDGDHNESRSREGMLADSDGDCGRFSDRFGAYPDRQGHIAGVCGFGQPRHDESGFTAGPFLPLNRIERC
jgi:hypothetical protein